MINSMFTVSYSGKFESDFVHKRFFSFAKSNYMGLTVFQIW